MVASPQYVTLDKDQSHYTKQAVRVGLRGSILPVYDVVDLDRNPLLVVNLERPGRVGAGEPVADGPFFGSAADDGGLVDADLVQCLVVDHAIKSIEEGDDLLGRGKAGRESDSNELHVDSLGLANESIEPGRTSMIRWSEMLQCGDFLGGRWTALLIDSASHTLP